MVQTQWRVGMALVGLDYSAIFKVAELHGMEMTPTIFRGLQTLEFDALEEQSRKLEDKE